MLIGFTRSKRILENNSATLLRGIEVEDMKKKNVLLCICSIITCILLICIMYMLMQWIESVYHENPGLRYLNLTKILGYGNVLPLIAAFVLIARYSIISKTNGISETARLLRILEKIFYIQAGYTFVSVNIVGFLENVGPLPIFILEFTVIFVCLTIALIFNIISDSLKVIE